MNTSTFAEPLPWQSNTSVSTYDLPCSSAGVITVRSNADALWSGLACKILDSISLVFLLIVTCSQVSPKDCTFSWRLYITIRSSSTCFTEWTTVIYVLGSQLNFLRNPVQIVAKSCGIAYLNKRAGGDPGMFSGFVRFLSIL